jgi:hypothetical protein
MSNLIGTREMKLTYGIEPRKAARWQLEMRQDGLEPGIDKPKGTKWDEQVFDNWITENTYLDGKGERRLRRSELRKRKDPAAA